MKLFGTGILFGVPTSDASGAAIANGTPVQFGTLQDISGDISFEEKLLYGSYQLPIMAARGKGKLEFKAKNADISAAIVGDLFFGQSSSAGIKAVLPNFAANIPATPGPYTLVMVPPSSGTFVSDLGVRDGVTGVPLQKVAAAPAAGQYECDATTGTYTFAAADEGKAVLISYEYSATSATGPRIITINNELMGYAPTFKAALNLSFRGKNATLVLNNCIASKLSLPFKNDDYSIPEFDFSAFADDVGAVGYIALSE